MEGRATGGILHVSAGSVALASSSASVRLAVVRAQWYLFIA